MESADTGTSASPDSSAPPVPASSTTSTPLSARPLLGRDEILSAPDLHFELVPVDEWRRGAVVRVSSLRSEARARLEDFLIARNAEGGAKERNEGVREMFVALCVCDQQGEPIFTIDDVGALAKKSARPIDRIFEVAKRLNDVSDEAVNREAGNSDSAASGTSPSPLP